MRTTLLLAAGLLLAGCPSLGDYQTLDTWNETPAGWTMEGTAETDGFLVVNMNTKAKSDVPDADEVLRSWSTLYVDVCPPGASPVVSTNWVEAGRASVSWESDQHIDWESVNVPVREGSLWKMLYLQLNPMFVDNSIRAYWVPLD